MLGSGVMVTQMTLDHPFLVRVQASQPALFVRHTMFPRSDCDIHLSFITVTVKKGKIVYIFLKFYKVFLQPLQSIVSFLHFIG